MSRTCPTTPEFDEARRFPPLCCTLELWLLFFTGISKYSNRLDAALVPNTRLLKLSKLSKRNCSPSVLCCLQLSFPFCLRASSDSCDFSSLCKVPLLQRTTILVRVDTTTTCPGFTTGLQLPWPRQWGARAIVEKSKHQTTTPLNNAFRNFHFKIHRIYDINSQNLNREKGRHGTET